MMCKCTASLIIMKNTSFSIKLSFRQFNTQMYKNCHLPNNMTEGSAVKIFGDCNYNPTLAFENCFDYLSKYVQNILILTNSYSEWDKQFRNKLKCECKDFAGFLRRVAFALVLQRLGRSQPLFHHTNFTSGRETIKMHMINPALKQDLVCDRNLARGYEAETVIVCNLKSKEHLSRASIQGIEMKYDQRAFVSYGYEWIVKNPDHICGELPETKS